MQTTFSKNPPLWIHPQVVPIHKWLQNLPTWRHVPFFVSSFPMTFFAPSQFLPSIEIAFVVLVVVSAKWSHEIVVALFQHVVSVVSVAIEAATVVPLDVPRIQNSSWLPCAIVPYEIHKNVLGVVETQEE